MLCSVGILDQIDWSLTNMEKPTFREMMEKGSVSQQNTEELEEGEISDVESPPHACVFPVN